jgi:putative FmdB family regulatory protein
MPTYEYACASCGPFDALRPIAERDRAADCPGCSQPAPRVLGGGPNLAGLAAATRRTMAAGERAAGDGSYPRMRHPAACRCC